MIVLGHLRGIEIRAHYSTLLVLGALTSILAYGYLPTVTPAASPLERLAVAVIVALLLAGSILAHELGHAWIAHSRGLQVTDVTLYLFGGLTNISGPRSNPSDEIAIGLAGPGVSATLAALFLASGAVAVKTNEQAGMLLAYIGLWNALLFAVNALPGYPMDGGMVLRGILWKLGGNAVTATRRAASSGKAIAYLICAGGVFLLFRGDVIGGMWVVLIGWLLAGLADGAYRTIIVRTALEGLQVKDLYARDLPVLQTADSVAAAAELFGGGAPSRVLAVMFGERLAGLVSDVDVARVPKDQAETTSLSAVMLRAGGQPTLDADCDAAVLLRFIPMSALRCVIVVDERGDYLGLVRQEDIARYVDMIEALGNSSMVSSSQLKRLLPRGSPAQPAESEKPS